MCKYTKCIKKSKILKFFEERGNRKIKPATVAGFSVLCAPGAVCAFRIDPGPGFITGFMFNWQYLHVQLVAGNELRPVQSIFIKIPLRLHNNFVWSIAIRIVKQMV